MTEKRKPTLGDLHSTPVNGREYISTIKSKSFQENYQKTYDGCNPKRDVLDTITAWIKKHDEKLHIIGIGAAWCHDCWDHIPLIIKIEETLDSPNFTTGIISGIKVKMPQFRKPGEYIWKVPPSPVETNDPIWDVVHIPTIYIFNRVGLLIGKIIEKLTYKKTMEEEIFYHLENPE